MSKKYIMSKSQYLRLQGYLYDLHISGEACVFSNFYGHIDSLNVRVTDSKDKYETTFTLYGGYTNNNYIQSDFKQDYKKMVDTMIEDIEEALKKRQTIIDNAKKLKEQAEREEFERLKEKFNGDDNA